MRIRSLAFALALLAMPVAAQAETSPAAAPADRIDQLIARAGLERQLYEFQSAMQEGISQAHAANPTLDARQLSRLRTSIDRVYSASRLRPRLHAELARMLSPGDIDAALAWIDSPAGRRIAAIEAKATTPEQRQRMMAALQRGAPATSQTRRELIDQIIRATRTDEFGASLVIESAAGIAEGISQSAPPERRAAARGVRSQMESERASLVSQMHAQSAAVFAVAYADATDADLQALLRYARSPAGARFHMYAAQAFETTAAQAARDLGSDLGRSMPANM